MDIEQPDELIAYLHSTGRIAPGEHPEMHVLAGGVSNRTVLVRRPGGRRWVLKQALEKLRVPTEWLSDPRRIRREAEGLRWLQQLAPDGTVPAFLFEDKAQHLLAMEAVEEPCENWKEMLLRGELNFAHVDQFAQLLATIHERAYRHREAVEPAFSDWTFFESLRLEPYYAYTAGQVPEAAAFLEQLIEDTRRRRITLVHGDYSPKNILIREDRLILLDHEVIHFGDPAFDLGFSLTHLLSKAHHLHQKREAFAEAAVRYWQRYSQQITGVEWAEGLEQWVAKHTMGCLLARVAGKSQLEYMSRSERMHQRQAVVALLNDPPATVERLILRFRDLIE